MQAMIESSFQDDMYDSTGDESVNRLQDRLVELTGKEAAMWALSGTMGNQICLRTHLTQPPHTVLLDHRAHVHCWESGALPVMSQAGVTQVHPKNGIHLTVEDVKKHMIADGNSMLPSHPFSSGEFIYSLILIFSKSPLPPDPCRVLGEFLEWNYTTP
jgi:threonine aldolase